MVACNFLFFSVEFPVDLGCEFNQLPIFGDPTMVEIHSESPWLLVVYPLVISHGYGTFFLIVQSSINIGPWYAIVSWQTLKLP